MEVVITDYIERLGARGISRVCPVCQKEFFVPYPDDWVFKRFAKAEKGTKPKLVYFDRWSCKKQFDAEYDPECARQRSEKQFEVQAHRTKHIFSDRKCVECRYCYKLSSDSYDCTYSQSKVNMRRSACRRFKPRYEDQEDME